MQISSKKYTSYLHKTTAQAGLVCLLFASCSPILAENFSGYAPVLSDGPGEYKSINPGDPGTSKPVVIDVVLHDKAEILKMLRRAESLATTPNSADRPRQIALVLHGPEIEHFKINNYRENQEIVDLAAKLDAFNVIDIKMCNTMMNQLNVEQEEVPAFIEIVPYGPGEVDRLHGEGFLNL